MSGAARIVTQPRRARALVSGQDLPLSPDPDGWVSVIVPALGLLEAVAFEP